MTSLSTLSSHLLIKGLRTMASATTDSIRASSSSYWVWRETVGAALGCEELRGGGKAGRLGSVPEACGLCAWLL